MIRTKAQIPPLRPDLVPRPRLIQKLNEGLQPGIKFTLVSAPAGYGKSTALTQWAHACRFSVGWVSLEPADNDTDRFLRYVGMAWERVHPDFRETPLGILLQASSPDTEAVLTAFVNLASELEDHSVLVLEDYHLIEEPGIHGALTFLLDHLPPTFHFILSSRAEPPLPLARYRAHGEVLEIGSRDLRFRPQETEAFLSISGLRLPAQSIRSIDGTLEGWAAGLQLAALALERGLVQADGFQVTGQQRFIADYLGHEVVGDLTEEVLEFLLQTSILERLCGSLCDAVTQTEGGNAMLQVLESERLFLSPLDERREWYRYHPIFAGYLSAELHRQYEEEVPGLHVRAGRWYLANGMYEQAFQHGVAGGDGLTVARIVERRLDIMLFIGQLNTARRWLDALPRQWYYEYPVIGLAHAQWFAFTGNWIECEGELVGIEDAILQSGRADESWQLARVKTVRCRIACAMHDLNQAKPLAAAALQDLPVTDTHYRASIHFSLGEAYREAGRWSEAEEHYHQALSLVFGTPIQLLSAHIYGALADMSLRRGRLREADGFWEKALAAIESRDSWGYLPLPLTGWVYIRKSELHYEWNELAQVDGLVRHGLKRAELGGAVEALIVGWLVRARLHLTRGDAAAAEASLERARPSLEDSQFHHWLGRFERLQVELWLAQKKLRTAVSWSDEMLQDETLAERPHRALTYMTVARVLIVRGDIPALQKALRMLSQLAQDAEAEGQTAIQIEAFALQALADYRRGDETGALAAVERALRLAEPEGYVRLFVDLGQGMRRLLQTALARHVMPGYVTKLLRTFGEDWQEVEERVMPEPLTRREKEVLQLIAAGLTNPEIARELVISKETVKKHASNIYGKLGVGNRVEAAALARQMNLID